MLILLSSIAFPGMFNFIEIDVLTYIILGQATGLSELELRTLALADFRFEKSKRKMTIVYCWKRGTGVGRYVAEIWDSDKSHENAIIFLLLKLERMTIIESAYDSWKGDERLELSSKLYESATLLQRKLRAASRELTNQQLQAFEAGEDLPDTLMNTLIKNENPHTRCYRLPCWIRTYKGYLTPRRMPPSIANEYVTNFICDYGYIC